jgi:hypothetical protein
MNWHRRQRCAVRGFLLLTLWMASPAFASAQQTVFNVPSPDVLARGELYGEIDVALRPVDTLFTAEPRLVAGVGHDVEVGLNFTGLAAPDEQAKIVCPTAKWKMHEWKASGWAVLAGDTVFLPVSRGSYAAGNYLYAIIAKQWARGTRVGLGGFDLTSGVVADANRAGVQITFEQPVTSRLQVAAEWMSGDHAAGYLSPGFVLKMRPRLTLYGAYQIGNHGVTHGNHNLLVELGYNFRVRKP